MSTLRKILAGGIIIIVAGFAIGYLIDRGPSNSKVEFPQGPTAPVKTVPAENPAKTDATSKEDVSTQNNLPDSFLLAVPFLAQAPFGKWDPLHEDACEEASLVMVKHFLAGDKNISLIGGDTELINLVNYETKQGYGISISVEQLATIAKDFANMPNGRVKNNITVDDIKRELVAGRPVIIPAAGKMLNNPNFRNGGPLYHMLVVKGYDATGFITNDPGTRLGENFHYSFYNLFQSIQNWDENSGGLGNEKEYLVFE
jgi:hypothetical protein